MNAYPLGQVVRISTLVKNQADALADPSQLTLTITKPDGSTITKVFGVDNDLIKDAVGTYHLDLTTDQRGGWSYRWHSTGALVTASSIQEFRVH
jgi:uncharacterized protein YfaS (alpha-2-macroglobulin family)